MPKILITTGPLAGTVVEGTATGGIILGDSSPDSAGELGYAGGYLIIHDGTAARNLIMEGVATGGIILGDSTPDAEGELGYASNQLSIHDGTASRKLAQLNSTRIYVVESLPIAWAIDGSVAAPGAVSTLDSSNKAKYRDFSGITENDIFVEWMVPYGIDTTVGVFYQIEGWVTNATGPAAGETIIFTLQGVSIGDSDPLGTAQGTAVVLTYTEPNPATHDQYDRLICGWSTVLTIANLAAGELAIFHLIRDTTSDTYAQAFGVGWLKIKYAITLQAS